MSICHGMQTDTCLSSLRIASCSNSQYNIMYKLSMSCTVYRYTDGFDEYLELQCHDIVAEDKLREKYVLQT